MRKIEQQMVAAIREGRVWHSGNTAVGEPNQHGWQGVFLHGYLIAACRIGKGPGGGLETQVDMPAFRTWPEMTTASRLRALGIPAHVKNGVAYIGNDPA